MKYKESRRCKTLNQYGFKDPVSTKAPILRDIIDINNINNINKKNKGSNSNLNSFSLVHYRETSKPSPKEMQEMDFRVFLEGIKQRDSRTYEAYRVCGDPLNLNDEEYVYVAHKGCKNRLCPICAPKRSLKYKKIMMQYFSDLKKTGLEPYLRFTTLTYENVRSLDDLQFSEISKDLNRFNRFLKSMGYEIFGGYRTLEIVFTEEKGYHVHVHMLYFADVKQTQRTETKFKKFVSSLDDFNMTYKEAFFPKHQRSKGGKSFGYIDTFFLDEVWRFCNHKDSYVTKPVLIRWGLAGGIGYITKYLSKSFEGIRDYDRFIHVNNWIRHKKIFQKFGKTFKSFKISSYKTFVYGLSGKRIRQGMIFSLVDWFPWKDVYRYFDYFTYYMPFYCKNLTMEENCILNALPS